MSEHEVVIGQENSPDKKKKKWYVQRFKHSWLDLPEFKDWLRPHPCDPYTGYCRVCDAKLKNCNKNGLKKHGESAKHKKLLENPAPAKRTIKQDPTSRTDFETDLDFFDTHEQSIFQDEPASLDQQVATAEDLLTGYFAENPGSSNQMEHLAKICKRVFPDSEVAQKLNFKKIKVSWVMEDGGVTCNEV